MENQGFSRETQDLVSVSAVHERNKAALLLSLSKQHTWVPTSTDLIGKPVQGYKVSRLLILTQAFLWDVPSEIRSRVLDDAQMWWHYLLQSGGKISIDYPAERNPYTQHVAMCGIVPVAAIVPVVWVGAYRHTKLWRDTCYYRCY